MPFTFSHPAAVVPLRKSFLNYPALVVGSLVPDLGYYLPFSGYFHETAHTFIRSFTFCLPAGLVVFAIWVGIRKGFVRLIWGRQSANQPPPRFVAADAVVVPLSLLVGSWSHIIWDSFTHGYGWLVRHSDVLKTVVFSRGNFSVRLYDVMQHVSTVLGAAVLILIYREKLWQARRRIAIWAAIAVFSGLVGAAFVKFKSPLTLAGVYPMTFDWAVVSVRILAGALLGASVVASFLP